MAAKGSVSDLIALKDLVQKFGDQIPQSAKDCLGGNAELTALGLKYGIKPTTDGQTIVQERIKMENQL